jgi:DNA-binding NarL/FixJ family response regulator
VLVADDSASIRSLVRITLTSQGWMVIEAETAESAMATARARMPDLAILDITFGDSGPDGLAVCAELKADAKTAGIPIIVLTAHDDPAERRRADAAGADAFVGKPFGPLELMNVVRDLIAAAPAAPALGIFLLDAGAVEPTVLERALIEQRELVQQGKPKRLGDVLLERGSVSSSALDRALLEQMHARSLKAEQARAQVLIVDDHAAVREGLKALIRGEEALDVVGEAADPAEGLRLARRHQPDVIVLDNEMHTGSGLDLIPTLRAEVPGARIVMFSLDSSVRERALTAGAHVFIAKDAPMGDILAALRPGGAAVPPTVEVTVPPLSIRRDLRRGALIIATALVLFVPLFLILEPSQGASAGVFSAVPVVVIGALLGPEAGLLGAVLVLALAITLESFTGHPFGEPMLAVGDGPGAVMVLLLGFAAGALRTMGLHVDPRRRRADAIAEATRVLAGLDRGEFVDALLDAMLRVAPGEAAALFGNAAGDARFVSATRPLSDARIASLAPLARDVMRSATSRMSALVPSDGGDDLRYAALAPVSVPGQDVRGVLALLGRRQPFSGADVALLRPFAQQLWMVMRSGPISRSAPVDARAKEHAG